jgi:PAS domain S-box-containing protein
MTSPQIEPTADFLASIVKYSDDAIITSDFNGRITSWNQSAERMFGYSAEEVIGRPMTMLAGPGRVEEMEEILGRIRRGMRIEHYETVRKAKDGRLLNVSLTVSPVKDSQGGIIGAAKIARDISGQAGRTEPNAVQTEQQIADFKDQLADELTVTRGLHELGLRLMTASDQHSMLDEILTAARTITRADMGNVQLLNEAGVLKIEAQQGFSQEFLDFFHSVPAGEGAACGTALGSGARIVVENVEESPIFSGQPSLTVLREAGVRAVQSTPMVTHGGVVVGMLSTHYRTPKQPSDRDLRLLDLLTRQAADLIAKVRAEAELRETQQQLLSITDNMAAAVSRCSRDYRYVWVSAALANWLGIPRDQIAGHSVREILGPKAFEEILPYIERVLSGEKVSYTAQVHYQSLGERWIQAVYIPAVSESGRVEGWTAVVTDITDIKENEARLLKANADLARANEALSQFAYAASHDLREPLRMVTAYSQLLLKGYRGELAGEAGTCIEYITQGTNRMQTLLTDLLAYAQITANAPGAVESVDLNVALEKAVENCKAGIEETGATLTKEHLPTIPGYEAHFVQLFQNLVGNALKYRGQQAPRIHVSAANENGVWRVGVADNGIGIDSQHHQKIFGLFKRLHGDRISGTGMGLAICQRIAELYGGRIWVESREGEGATFYFTLASAAGASVHA